MDGVGRNVKRLTRLALTTIGLPMAIYVLIVGFQPQPAEAQSGAGAEVYSGYCASCHQAGGQGLAGAFPPLAGNPSAADVDYVAAVIQEGVTGPLVVLGETFDGAMPAISGLEKSELKSVVAYVASLAGGQGTTSTPPPSVEPPAPTMRPVFSDQPLAEAEIADVVAFLADAPDLYGANKE
jgi:mono/diheme cytochrome c family protein